MPVVTPGEDTRVSEGLNRWDMALAKGKKARIAIMFDQNITARRHFIEQPEEGKSTVVACERDYGRPCIFCDNATGSYQTPIQEAKVRHVVPILLMESVSNVNGIPFKAVVDGDGQYIGDLTPMIWDFGWASSWNAICDRRDDVGFLAGAEAIIEMTNPGNKQVTVTFPSRTFLPEGAVEQALKDYEEEAKEPFPTMTKLEEMFVGPRVDREKAEELVANSGADVPSDDEDGVEDPFADEDTA